jgi:hypothetical protein
MRRGSGFRNRSAFKAVLYDSLVRDRIERELARPSPINPPVVVPSAEDRRDALKGAA